MSKLSFDSYLKLMCQRNVPFVLVDGAIDEPATVRQILLTLGIQETEPAIKECIYTWDSVGGLAPSGNSSNFSEAERMLTAVKADKVDTSNPRLALAMVQKISDHLLKSGNPSGVSTAVVWFTGDRLLSEKNEDWLRLTQLMMNMRDDLSNAQLMLIFVGIAFDPPPELKEHIKTISAPLPDKDEIYEEIDGVYGAYNDSFDPKRGDEKFVLDDDKKYTYSEALRGVSSFQVRQNLFLALDNRGIHLDRLRENAIQTINRQRGLSVQPSGGIGFDGLGGLDSLKGYLSALKDSKNFNPKILLFVDEIEKGISGSGGSDTSGVSTNTLGSVLTEMQETEAYGLMLTGVYGCGKSAIAKAFGQESGAITIHLDIAGMKDSLVGSSETNLRNALRTIRAIGGDVGGIMWIATCNRIDQLPPELKRRYWLGTYFFALPSAEERAVIWRIYADRYKLSDSQGDWTTIDDEGWTGAEIESCCRLAWLLGCSVEVASKRITPVAVTARDEIQSLCREADGRFLDATHDGLYQMNRRDNKPVKTVDRPTNRVVL